MNFEDIVEERLSGWTPRRPSRRLERRLFGSRSADAGPGLAPAWRWLTPASGGVLACLVLGLRMLDGSTVGMAQPEGGDVASVSCSGVRSDALIHANSWSGQRFESTRPIAFHSSIGPMIGLVTNRLAH
jgi:hypothetical protein